MQRYTIFREYGGFSEKNSTFARKITGYGYEREF